MKRFLVPIVCAALAALAFGSHQVLAHASLTTCSIKNNQVFTVARTPKVITAKFAEPLDPNKSFMQVFEGQADHGLVTETQKSRVTGPQQMTLRLPKLGKEKYYMLWYTHSAADGHFAAGLVYFQVK